MRNMIGDKPVMVRMHGALTYGREVGEVIVDGRSVNRELVRIGLAWWYRGFAEYDSGLERLEKKARAKRIGLWEDDNPIKPGKWRKMDH